MRPPQQNAGPAVDTAETIHARIPVPARQTFGVRASVPGHHPERVFGPFRSIGSSGFDRFKAVAAGHYAALLADIADVRAALRKWLHDFGIYFSGLLKETRRPAPRAQATIVVPPSSGERRETLIHFVAYAAAVGALAFVASYFLQPPSVAASVEPMSPQPEWLTIAKPYPAFELSLPDLGEEGSYAIMRHSLGGGRKDIITYGEAGRSLSYAMVEIYRPGDELDQLASVPSEIAARARELAPAGEVSAALPLETKFGSIATVEFTMGRFGVGHCLGFMRVESEPNLQISGMACAMNQIVSRKAVACMLDRLTLISAGSDPDIARYFAQAEIRRTFCGQRDPLLYATPKRDYPGTSTVGLRGRLSAR